MRIAIIADTHLPKGTRHLPEACVEQLEAAELIIHAGDLNTLAVLRELESYAQVIAVHGNVDEYEVRETLAATAILEVGDVKIAVIHDAGPANRRLTRLRRRFPNADAVVFGHSHTPLHETAPDGFQIFNPGSPTERRRASRHTMGLARVQDRALTFELVDLD